ncbi:MAG: hypothetical protein GY947_19255, partial [Rhodobacteraceae bacterium]|nr:hypothetical protein [Paracoccaceae bacterium]
LKATMEADIATLSAERNTVEKDLLDLSKVASKLVTDHQAAATALEVSKAELAEMETLKTTAVESINAAKLEFEAAKRDQETFVVDMRKAQPIEAVVSDVRVVESLKAKGIVTVDELSKMTNTSLKKVLTGTGLEATTVKADTVSFINK